MIFLYAGNEWTLVQGYDDYGWLRKQLSAVSRDLHFRSVLLIAVREFIRSRFLLIYTNSVLIAFELLCATLFQDSIFLLPLGLPLPDTRIIFFDTSLVSGWYDSNIRSTEVRRFLISVELLLESLSGYLLDFNPYEGFCIAVGNLIRCLFFACLLL